LKGLLALDINIEALFVQLYNTSSLRTSIELFTNSLDGEEKMSLPLLEELPSRTLTKRVAWLRRICKFTRQILVEKKKYKITMKA
jgi:hypothetical protein